MKVYVNDQKYPNKRKLVDVELVEDRETTILVKLPDGNMIRRKKKRDLPDEKS